MNPRRLTVEELLLCKAVSSEEFPGRGWVGLIMPDGEHQRVVAVHTRIDLYRKVRRLMNELGEDFVRREVSDRRLPKGHDLMFVAHNQAVDDVHAAKIMDENLARRR